MKNVCKGCGEEIQNTSVESKGYSPKLDSTYCKRCFRKMNYGEGENNLEVFDSDKYLTEISNSGNEVIMVIDILDPKFTIIKNINKYIKPERLTLAVNKVDILPKSISDETIIKWIDGLTLDLDLEFKNLVLVSSYKNKNIDAISDMIKSSNKDVSIIGYSNVGKSSLVKSIFKANSLEANNLVSKTIGTTTKPIELEFFDTKIIDYPGFILETSIHNKLSNDKLKKLLPQKEIKIRNYQLNEGQLINIEDILFFETNKQEGNEGYQFIFSNEANLHRGKFENKEIDKSFVKNLITPLKGVERQDIIISGVGIITFNNKGQTINIYAPKNVGITVVESIFN